VLPELALALQLRQVLAEGGAAPAERCVPLGQQLLPNGPHPLRLGEEHGARLPGQAVDGALGVFAPAVLHLTEPLRDPLHSGNGLGPRLRASQESLRVRSPGRHVLGTDRLKR
jgi:hypothetical protein